MKYLFIIMFLFLGFDMLLSQDNSSYHLTLDHLALSVKDVDKSADFYKNALKLQEITNRTEMPGIRWFSLGDGKELHLISTIKEEVSINKAVHLALKTPHFDAFVMKLEEMNIAYSDWPGTHKNISIRADGIKQIFFQDVDGYWIEVNSVGQH